MGPDWQPLFLTFKLATLTTLILCLLGVPLAWWLSQTRVRIKPALEALVSMPLVLPPSVLASVLFSLPFMVHPVQAGFQGLPAVLAEAACTLGKSRWQTFLHVLLPNIRPALLSGIVLAFAHTIGEFGVVLMIGGNLPDQTRVASIAIYDEVESLNYAAANFYALVLFSVCFAILLAVYLLNRRMVRSEW